MSAVVTKWKSRASLLEVWLDGRQVGMFIMEEKSHLFCYDSQRSRHKSKPWFRGAILELLGVSVSVRYLLGIARLRKKVRTIRCA